MLIYNSNKKFIGIDQSDLNILGYASLQELLSECNDIADLFVKKPGFIHNFKNFEWIDFVLHAESEDTKAIIHAKGKNYSCELEISQMFLLDTPNEDSYVVRLNKLKQVSASLDAEVAKDLAASPILPVINKVETQPITKSEIPDFSDDTATELNEPNPLDIPDDNSAVAFDPYDDQHNSFIDEPLEIDDDFQVEEEDDHFATALDVGNVFTDDEDEEPDLGDDFELDDDFNLPVEDKEEPQEKPMLGDYINTTPSTNNGSEFIDELKTPKDYRYNPEVAADELGLPVDLIEEFIGDFIQQAHDFKDELYKAVEAHDSDEVKVLSHKLKGVAANLRIEDSFEVLSNINSSSDFDEISANLNHFYKLLSILEGKEPEPEPEPEIQNLNSTSEALEDDNKIDDIVDVPLDSEDKINDTTKDDFDLDQLDDDLLKDLSGVDDEKLDISLDDEKLDISLDDDLYDLGLDDNKTIDDTTVQTSNTDSVNDVKDDDLYEFDLDEDLLSSVDETENTQNNNDDDLYDIDIKDDDSSILVMEEPKEEVASVVLSFDKDRAADELGLDKVLVNELIDDFKSHSLSLRDKIDEAILINDENALNRYVFELKGISDNLRMTDISNALNDLKNGGAKEALDKTYDLIGQL